jgi:hypothetical protein
MLLSEARKGDRPWIVAVDGRSGNGKSTAARLFKQAIPASAVVHTDDVAWHHSFFGWSDLLIEGILKPLHRGDGVCYRPPGWLAQGRSGAIEVAAGLDLVVVEGVGASRIEVLPWIDRCVWVQSDIDEAERRGIVRDGGTVEARSFWHEWAAEEVVFLERQQPWKRASVIVNGTPDFAHDPLTEIVISPPLVQEG